ncbi:putative ribonuclease Z [Capnocytophaga sp. oral taxon 380 str. F0488]|nr:putative ribonuclease Z [Capnocytophaga sp. oral taxon 380 str. F0488]
MHIYGPKGIKEAVLVILKLGGAYTPFPLYFHELSSKTSELLYEDDKVLVRTIPLQHRVYTNGFLFQEKEGERRLNIDAIAEYPEIQTCDYQNIKNGKDITLENGKTIANTELTFDPHRPQSYAYCSDTLYFEALATEIQGARVVYHESTFLKINEELAVKTMHSTAYQAGLTAKNAHADALILGHYSSRYPDVNLFKQEAQEVFKNVFLAEDGKKFIFDN